MKGLHWTIPCVFAIAALSLVGCKNFMYETTGDTMGPYSVEHVFPYQMSKDDVGMACETGVSMGTFLMSYGRVVDEPHRAAITSLLSAAMCAEGEAWEYELEQLRALNRGDAAGAKDARIAEKRAHVTAAKRYYEAYQHLVAAYGEPGESCPTFDNEEYPDEAIYLVGLTSGVLAMIHDRASDVQVNVPTDIPRAVERATECLDDSTWWGGPKAIRSAVWISVPGGAPEGVDPWVELNDAAEMGDAKGMSFARGLLVQTSFAMGQSQMGCQAMADYLVNVDEVERNETWRLLDAYSGLIIQHESDKLWTRSEGHRTPIGELGCWWDDAAGEWSTRKPEPMQDDSGDEFLDDILGDDDDNLAPDPMKEGAGDAGGVEDPSDSTSQGDDTTAPDADASTTEDESEGPN